MKLSGKLGTLLLAIWLILTGLVPLLNLNIPAGNAILAILAIAAGILILTEMRSGATKNLGRLVLAIWLILTGLLPLFSITFPASGTVLAILAAAAGILLLIRRSLASIQWRMYVSCLDFRCFTGRPVGVAFLRLGAT